ncbi:putative Smr domain-containing protein [Quillaja saponaria]|uniref:Smr domain-containing protein n=1 Tax=Quillaja saponaria TaxID=32244 RepID=A0AAD7KVS5_QUISA|nr:putative Smr domain-containing protein [Quillaja saponaria]
MEVSSPSVCKSDIEEKALKTLLDAFGSAFSLDQIASAFCKASRNPDLAGEILYDMQRSNSTSATHESTAEASIQASSTLSDGFTFGKSNRENENSKTSKPKLCPVSLGTVSGKLGKHYIRSVPPANGSYRTTKPLKLDTKVMPMTEIRGVESKSNFSRHDRLHQDMEDFLFKMLGDGYQLDRDVIREVLGTCGYDMQKSMEKLLDQTAKCLDKRKGVVGESKKFTDTSLKSGLPSCARKFKESCDGGPGVKIPGQLKERDDLQKEVLAALFIVDERPEESPRRKLKDVRRYAASGQVVTEPPRDSIAENKTDLSSSHQDNVADVDKEDDYQVLRRAVKEYRGTMMEYYKAAVDAFSQRDHVRAEKLVEQGQFFNNKAREADEESSKMIFETRSGDAEEMLLDLHDIGAKEAIRLLKCHLSSLSGIPSINYLKVIIEANDEDISKGSRKRLIMKLLKDESIDWKEGNNAGTILIRLDSIVRTRLSFFKK